MKKLAVFYHLFIPEPMESWVWWVEEQMGLLQSTGLADNAEVFLCTTLPLGMVNQKIIRPLIKWSLSILKIILLS